MHCSLRMQVWVPDAERKMTQATACFFNDASWLKAVGLRMVHPDIDNSTAELLGCKSQRIQHLVCFHPLPLVCWTLTLLLVVADGCHKGFWACSHMRHDSRKQSLSALYRP